MLPMCHSPIGASDTSGIIIIYFFLLVKGDVKRQVLIRILSKSKRKCRLRVAEQEKCNMDEGLCCIFLYTSVPQNLRRNKQRISPAKKVRFIFEKVLDLCSLLWYCGCYQITGGNKMILQALKNMYPKASEKVLKKVIKDLEKCRGKNMSTVELADWIGKLVTAHTIEEALNLSQEDDSKPSQVGNESSSVVMEVSDE